MVRFNHKERVRVRNIRVRVGFWGEGWVTVRGKVNSVTSNVNQM